METVQTILTIFAVFTGVVVLAFLDKRFALGLNTGLGEGANNLLFGCSSSKQQQRLAQKDEQIKALEARVAVLEKIVTDPAEQLKREIDSLR